MGKFSKIKKHSKSFSYLDEKIVRLNADIQNTLLGESIPTNNTSNFNVVEPSKTSNINSIEVNTVLNLIADDHSKFGADTSGIFDKNGRSILIEPPGYWRGTSLDPFAALGPMISYYDSISDTTYLGYVRENDRSMVNLGRIAGKISNWDQESNFTSYGQLSLEQAQWYFREYNNNGVENYRVFYSGKSDSTDPYNRVFGKIINTPKNNVSEKYSKKKYIENIEELIRTSKLPFNLNPEKFLTAFNYLNSDLNLERQTKTQEMLVDLVLTFNDQKDGKLAAALMRRGDKIPSNNTPSPGKLFASYQTSGKFLSEEESDPQPGTPQDNPQAYETPLVTGGGRVETYPEGERLLLWVRQRSEAFISGFFNAYSVAEMQKVFSNTSISAQTAYDLEREVDRLEEESIAARDYYFEIFDELQPLKDEQLAIMSSSLAADPPDLGTFYTALAELDRLFAITDAALDASARAASRWINKIVESGSYIKTGRLFSKDPYQIDDPTVALAKQKNEEQKKKDAEIKKEIENLKQAASDSQKAATLNRLKAYGLGALVAGVAVLGVAALFIPAVNASLGPAVMAALRTVFNVAKGPGDDALVIGGRTASQTAKMARNFQRQNPGKYNPFLSDKANQLARQQGVGTNVKGQNPAFRNPLKNSYEPQGQVLSEDRKRILKDLKKPVILPEAKQEKIKHKPKVIGSAPRSVGESMMKQAEVPTSFKPMEEKMWGKYEQHRNARASQERKNQVLDLVGTSDHAWEWITETIRKKGNDVAYENFVSKSNTLKEQETLQADKDPLFKRVASKLKPALDYPDKPSPNGFPDSPPPNMIMGYHPEYGERDAYYNTLDPQSAKAMPSTGNKKIDDKVQKARRIKKIVKGA